MNVIKDNFPKAFALVVLLSLNLVGLSQEVKSMDEVERIREIAMTDAYGRSTNGTYRYYAKGESKPFTGILFAKFANGNYSSWQEYVDGLGQGKWINYYEDGSYREIGYYNNNLVEGPIKKYHPNGKLEAEGNYRDWRVRIGEWRFYDLNGDLQSLVDYGEKGSIEEVKEFYEKGEIPYQWYADILSRNGFKE